MVVTIPYKVYSVNDLSSKLKANERIILTEINHLSCALVFCDNWLNLASRNISVAHLEFYALSNGWHKFTGTGYKSHFFDPAPSDIFSDEDVILHFNALLEASCFNSEDMNQTDLFCVF